MPGNKDLYLSLLNVADIRIGAMLFYTLQNIALKMLHFSSKNCSIHPSNSAYSPYRAKASSYEVP
jgi:hypothetical protein